MGIVIKILFSAEEGVHDSFVMRMFTNLDGEFETYFFGEDLKNIGMFANIEHLADFYPAETVLQLDETPHFFKLKMINLINYGFVECILRKENYFIFREASYNSDAKIRFRTLYYEFRLGSIDYIKYITNDCIQDYQISSSEEIQI